MLFEPDYKVGQLDISGSDLITAFHQLCGGLAHRPTRVGTNPICGDFWSPAHVDAGAGFLTGILLSTKPV